jgi:uncharacterized cofD-like protein
MAVDTNRRPINARILRRWLTPGIGIKRWLALGLLGIGLIALAVAIGIIPQSSLDADHPLSDAGPLHILLSLAAGVFLVAVALYKFTDKLITPYRRLQQGHLIDVVYAHNKRHKGLKVVAIGGGTGLPPVLRGLKQQTSNITAIVTVADDGGSSGRLRRETGALPPGDLRNNIAALADDENLMTRLFQYRFDRGDLGGHAFGNLFITALAGVSGGIESALTEIERVLNVQGRVLPSTLEDVRLLATVVPPGKSRGIKIQGESRITEIGGSIEQIGITPENAAAYPGSVHAILEADLVVIGPGSLYTSILPNLLVRGIADALRATSAYKVYICNVATQPGETEGYTVADHVLALERHVGRGVFQLVLANNAFPTENAGENTHYVQPVPANHEISQRYEIRYLDLTDRQQPWRHDPQKLAEVILQLHEFEKSGGDLKDSAVANRV